MSLAKTLLLLALPLAGLAGPAAGEPVQAGLIHKWIDADGVTHYSDQPPARAAVAVTRIEMAIKPGRARSPDGDYYSIGRQWQRMRAERLEREQIALEKARFRAAGQAREAPAPRPATVATRYAPGYPLFHDHHHRHRALKPRAEPRPAGNWPPGLHPDRNRLPGGYEPLP